MADKEAMAEGKSETEEGSSSTVFADNECAQALLDLAKSYSPPNGISSNQSEDLFSPDSLFSISSALYMNGSLSTDKLKKRREGKSSSSKTSILKRQLEHTDRRGFNQHLLENYDPNIAVKIECQNNEDLRCELVKRIKLDHNYPCAGDFSWNRYVKALSHPSGDAPNKPPGKSNDGKPRKDNGPSSSQTSGSNGSKSKRSSPDQKTNSGKSPNKANPLLLKGNMYTNNNNCVNVCEMNMDPMDGLRLASQAAYHHQLPKFDVLKPEKDISSRFLSSADLYQPDDTKYKNFNLLLKCLTTDENVEEKASPREGTESVRSLSTHDVSVGSEDGIHPLSNMPECSEYQCMCCSRVFQQKRYMTKHMRRMHPEVMGGERRKEDTVTCPSCGLLVLRKSFKLHSNTCNLHTKKSKKQLEMDLANCQFCGIRMRRHILVRHLAQEHCVENIRDANLFFLDDSDSSTLSGSEHDQGDDDDDDDEDDAENEPQTYPYQESNSWQSDHTSNQVASDAVSRQASESTVGFQQPAVASSRDTTPDVAPISETKNLTQVKVTCHVCGKVFAKNKMVDHLKEVHNADASNEIDPAAKDAEIKRNMCSHSMLQRFLSENSQNASPLNAMVPANEECRSCVQRLMSQSHDDDGYVSSNNNYASRLSPTNPPTSGSQPKPPTPKTNATYTIFIPKESLSVNSIPDAGKTHLGSDIKPAAQNTPHSLINAESIG